MRFAGAVQALYVIEQDFIFVSVLMLRPDCQAGIGNFGNFYNYVNLQEGISSSHELVEENRAALEMGLPCSPQLMAHS